MKTSEFPAVIEAKKIVQERMKFYNDMMKERKDESHLPTSEQSLVFRLRKRAEIRRQIKGRKSVEEGKPDRIADLLEENMEEGYIQSVNVNGFVGALLKEALQVSQDAEDSGLPPYQAVMNHFGIEQ